MIRSSFQIVKEEPFFLKDLISFKHIDKRLFIIFPLVPFGSPLTMIGLLSKRSSSTSENKESNVLFGIIK